MKMYINMEFLQNIVKISTEVGEVVRKVVKE